MDVMDVISGRYSVRGYKPEQQVPADVLRRILEAGRLAPSAANRQPWRFYLVSSESMLAKVRAAYPRSWFVEAPHILIVAGDKSKSWVRPSDGYNAIETDLTIAMDHMILAAESMGVATCWIGNFDPAILSECLGLSSNEMVFAMTPLGYKSEVSDSVAPKKRKSLEEVVRFC